MVYHNKNTMEFLLWYTIALFEVKVPWYSLYRDKCQPKIPGTHYRSIYPIIKYHNTVV